MSSILHVISLPPEWFEPPFDELLDTVSGFVATTTIEVLGVGFNLTEEDVFIGNAYIGMAVAVTPDLLGPATCGGGRCLSFENVCNVLAAGLFVEP